MPLTLNILTEPPKDWPKGLMNHPVQETEDPVRAVSVFDLTTPSPDYEALLVAIFAADAVHVW